MPYTIIQTIVNGSKFCCPYALFHSLREHTYAAIGSRLGVSRWSVRYWGRKIRDGECRCERREICVKRRLGTVPTIELKSLGKRGSDPFV